MHEMALAESIVQLVEETAAREGARRVSCIVLEIGQLAAVESEALRFCFAAAARQGVACGAALEIRDVPGSGRCGACGETVALLTRYDICPACGHAPLEIVGGLEMRVREIGIESSEEV